MKKKYAPDWRLAQAFRRVDRDKSLRKQQGRCRYCLRPLQTRNATVEHLKPRAHGGTDHSKNIAATCEPCNAAKGDIPDKDFMAQITGNRPTMLFRIQMVRCYRRIWSAQKQAEERMKMAFGARAKGQT